MALIKCNECGHKVSDRADFCPQCGCPIEKKEFIVCKECGAEVEKPAVKCPSCGFPFQAPTQPTPPKMPTQTPPPAPVLSHVPAQEPAYEEEEYSEYDRPSSGLAWAIVTTILFCVPFGIVAIVFASKVNSAWDDGRYDDAFSAARKAKIFSWISFGLGLSWLFIMLSGM